MKEGRDNFEGPPVGWKKEGRTIRGENPGKPADEKRGRLEFRKKPPGGSTYKGEKRRREGGGGRAITYHFEEAGKETTGLLLGEATNNSAKKNGFTKKRWLQGKKKQPRLKKNQGEGPIDFNQANGLCGALRNGGRRRGRVSARKRLRVLLKKKRSRWPKDRKRGKKKKNTIDS